MKKIILAITLLFSHVSFGLDAMDGKSIICTWKSPNPGDELFQDPLVMVRLFTILGLKVTMLLVIILGKKMTK